jgi:hypothetical protein
VARDAILHLYHDIARGSVESKVGLYKACAGKDRPAVVSEQDSGTDSVQRAEPEAEAEDRG